MAHLSGSFSNPHAGVLRVVLEGTFEQGTARDAGFPTGASDILIRGSVGGNKTQSISRNAPTVTASFNYPGGNAAWAVTTETVATSTSGIAIYGFKNLKMTLTLHKATGS